MHFPASEIIENAHKIKHEYNFFFELSASSTVWILCCVNYCSNIWAITLLSHSTDSTKNEKIISIFDCSFINQNHEDSNDIDQESCIK